VARLLPVANFPTQKSRGDRERQFELELIFVEDQEFFRLIGPSRARACWNEREFIFAFRWSHVPFR
jgi:hypothetical protein